MKKALFAVVTLTLMIAATGCHHNLAKNGCNSGCNRCNGGHSRLANNHGPGSPDYVPRLRHHQAKRADYGPPGPPTAAYAYPYYTTHGPRDFLLDQPPGLGR